MLRALADVISTDFRGLTWCQLSEENDNAYEYSMCTERGKGFKINLHINLDSFKWRYHSVKGNTYLNIVGSRLLTANILYTI